MLPNIVKTIMIPEELAAGIQHIAYENEMYQTINAKVITLRPEVSKPGCSNVNREIINIYMQSARNAANKFKESMDELMNEYGQEFKDDPSITINVDYNCNELAFIKSDTYRSCEVGKDEIVKEVDIDPQLNSYIQRLNFETDGYASIIATILTQDPNNLTYGTKPFDKDTYEFYMNKMTESNKEFKLAFGMLIYAHGPEFKHNNLVFANLELEIDVLTFIKSGKGGCSTCKTHIKEA